ncbi:Sec7 domain-containing protein [Pseudomassariella vexata]|uniref:Sec7 domain-containing protein n=1 Tax=Pseudomassariella vexata TaxID=1141098 RepID=A0A1Y2DJR3_9PEZI|nr:Sec7 domain-containing protein [Pseudomassariella vexata]ORY59461.1 Sec7 domain-containing protein [Pseudomassariella vexata]
MSRDAQTDQLVAAPLATEPVTSELPSRPAINTNMVINISQAPSAQYRSRHVAVAVDPVSLVISECISVTSAMRKHARWAGSSVSSILGGNPNPVQLGPPSPLLRPGSRGSSTNVGGDVAQDIGVANRWGLRGKKGKSMQDNPLMAGFGRLRHELSTCKDIHEFDAPALLNPFLQVVQASSTSAPITTQALKAIKKFLSYGFFSPDSPRFPLAMQSLSTAITHCRFEASDSAQDEVVLLMILQLMEDMLSGPGGALLSDESVCEMMECGLTMCCQSRLSELLRRTAESAMVKMCQIIFEHLKHLEVQAGDDIAALDEQTNGDMDAVKMVPATNGHHVIASSDAPVSDPMSEPRPSSSSDKVSKSTEESLDTETDELDIKPYSLPSMKELFRVLVDLLDPHDRTQGDTMRVMALRIIHVALEVAGPSIARHPALANIAEDKLCRFLFQLVRSDNMAILQESLIVAGTLVETCRGVLKLQQELFLSYLVACLHPPIEIPREPGIDPSLYDGIPQAPKLVKPPPSQSSSGRSTPVPVKDRQKLGMEGGARKPDARQAMVESVGALARMPGFMVELFVNYDCDTNRMDMCEDMIGLLSRNALPDSATWSTTSVPPLCLDALLGHIQFIADRLDDEPAVEGYPDQERLREQRRRKRHIIKGTSKFNEKPEKGLVYLQSQGIIKDVKDPVSVARFLKGSSSRVSKKVLGEYLSKRGNDELLTEFINLFEFSGKRVDEALRLLLESFRLPGESALIERIVTTFAKKYISSDVPQDVASEDAVFVLTYAIIMLNTDQHNPTLMASKRMAMPDFARNLRGVNAGEDFAPEYLQAIFESIKTNEIILPDEHNNKHAFDYAWKELLLKVESTDPLVLCNTNIYDADMFATTWRPIVSTLSYVFMSATDDAVFARVVSGFDQCAQIASKYGITEALDRIIYCLSYMTTLATDSTSNTSLNTEMKVSDDGTSVMVSELAVKLGRDFKAQLATLVLFRVVTGSEGVIRDGWQHIIRIWLNLFVNSLIPPFFASDAGSLDLPTIPLHTPSQVIDRAAKTTDTGLFSALSSYISSYAADDPPEPSTEEVESTLSTVDCVNACHMGDVFANLTNLPASSLQHLVEALLDQLPEDDISTVPVITVKPEDIPSSPTTVSKQIAKKPAYDPSVVYILEFCTILALRDSETVDLLGKVVTEALQAVLRDSSRYHPILVSRASFYQFNILKASYEHDFVRAPVLLHTISSFPKDTLTRTSQLVLQGLKVCINQPGPLRSEIMTSPDFWVLLRTLAGNAESSPVVFEILEGGVSGTPSAIIADNYEAAILLLNEFATAAKVGAAEQKTKPGARRPRSARPPKKETPSENAIVSRGVKAVNIIYSMTSRIPHLMKQSHLESNEAWSAYWLPIFQALTTQCTNPCREVRHLAFSSLQRSLLSPELTCSDHEEWTAIFGEVLFPLILKLLKPEVFSSDRDGMSETRVQTASLLCKVFLQYLLDLSKWEGMLDLWLKIIDIMDRLMNSGQGDSLEEAVPENLKNVLLFMSSTGLLVAPSSDPTHEKLWVETWKRIDRFLPDLRNELALDTPEANTKEGPPVERLSTLEGPQEASEKDPEKVAPA